jgi:DNA-binding MarR family transcriptional regulator
MSAAAVVIPFPGFVLPERAQPLAFQQLETAAKAAIRALLDQDPRLTSSAKRVWLYCSGFVGRKAERYYLHHAKIAEKLGIGKKTVQRALKDLADSGWLKYEPGAGFRENKIWLMLPASTEEQLDKMTSCPGQIDQFNRTNCPVDINSPVSPIKPSLASAAPEPPKKLEKPKTSETLVPASIPLCGEKFSKASNRKNSSSSTTAVETITNHPTPYDPPLPLPPAALPDAVKACAARIYENHPFQRRDISLGKVERRITEILRYRELAGEPALAYLGALADRHGGWCRCRQWREQDGRFAKALSGWLAPKEERYEIDSPEQTAPASPEPRGLQLWEIK